MKQPETIPLSVPSLQGKELEYIKECLDTNWVSSVGKFVDQFEKRFADYVGARFAVATVNCTSALHVALLVAGVESGDEVLLSDLTFIAPANAIGYCGAHPIPVDVEDQHWQMDVAKAEEFLENCCSLEGGDLRNSETGRRVKAILPVHILGHPVDLDPVNKFAQKWGLSIVEDASESLGASYRGRKVGEGNNISCFSFNGNKMITTGGGGMIVTNDESVADRARHLTTQAKLPGIEYQHDSVGFNYRMPNINAALGCAQLSQLDSHVAARRAIAGRYLDALSPIHGIRMNLEANWASSAWWLPSVYVSRDHGVDSRELICQLNSLGIQARPLWKPVHMQTQYAQSCAAGGAVSEELWRGGISLPSSPGLSIDHQNLVIRELLTMLQKVVG